MDKVADGYGLVEAPVWHDQLGLLFSDVLGGGVFRLGLDAEVSQVIPKRRGVGGMALHANSGLVVGGRNIAWVGANGETRVLLDPAVIPGASTLQRQPAPRLDSGLQETSGKPECLGRRCRRYPRHRFLAAWAHRRRAFHWAR